MKFNEYLSGTKSTLNEAKFNEKRMLKATRLFAKVLSREFHGEFKTLGTEEYKRSDGTGIGIRMMNDKGAQIRFNWDKKISKVTDNVLTSIDYWIPKNTNFQKPTRRVVFNPDANVVQIMGKITKALDTGRLSEKRNRKEKEAFLQKHGLPKSLAGSEKGMRSRAEKEGLADEIEVFLGTREKNTFEEDLQKTEKKFSKEVYADPETVFQDIEDLLSLVAQGKWRTLIVCGMGGVRYKNSALVA